MGIPNIGPKFVSGSVSSTGRIILVRDDGTVDHSPMVMCLGTVTDVTEDGIVNIDFPGGS